MMAKSENSQRNFSLLLLALTSLNVAFQIAWFWRFYGHNITMDAVNYIGLARHLLDGDFTASLHGYWSPLFPWMIAAGSIFTHDFTVLGRLLTIISFCLCLPLLYALTFSLWRSHLAASLAVLWFSLARGVIAGALAVIQADFLITACSLTYFLLLLACLRRGSRSTWFLLGVVHAIAFLVKAFAMPWLFVTTALALVVCFRKSPKAAAMPLLLAFLAPAVMWLTWGEALKTKYGVFTTGYQLRRNLMINLKRSASRLPGDPYAFGDLSNDKYMVGDTSWQALQEFNVMNPALLPVILNTELRIVPRALKEEVILLSPGGVLALAVGLALLTRKRENYRPETTFAWLAAISFATLVGAYGMLVFDGRYILPITVILIAIASGFMVPAGDKRSVRLEAPAILRWTALGLLLASTLFFVFYKTSPFRTVDRDFQISCYHAGALLRQAQPSGGTLVSIGNGPYPEHGTGFEAGVYAAYLSGSRLTAMNSALPEADATEQLVAAALNKKTDAVLVWGQPSRNAYQTILNQLRISPGFQSDQAILDPKKGEVGRALLFSR